MNVMEEVVKLRSKFAELHCFFGEVFPNHDKLKEYAQFLETECIMYKELLCRAKEQGEPKPLPTTQVKSSAEATASGTLPADIEERFTKFVAGQKDIPPEFAQVVNDNFWDLVGR